METFTFVVAVWIVILQWYIAASGHGHLTQLVDELNYEFYQYVYHNIYLLMSLIKYIYYSYTIVDEFNCEFY